MIVKILKRLSSRDAVETLLLFVLIYILWSLI